MERKTKVAVIVIVCVILAAVILVVVFFGEGTLLEQNHAKDYILDELDGEIIECIIEEEYHMCHLVYREDGRKVGEIWIYYHPGGVQPYKEYTFTGDATQAITSEKVIIFLGGNADFRRQACDLYNEKFGFHCTPFERPER
ncbi:MAG: hypothetical protein HXS46_05645 [Theionarchaea archaeon]|nr:MAG: hypothetical protein AYK18_11950 [Theionarchaea archaeon DG-70]MBU7010153.1 hypothetical protein [Theionarchaea archaeon]